MSDETIKKAAYRGIKLLDGGNPPVPENTVAQSSAPAAIRLIAEQHGREVIEILLDIAISGDSEAARVAACKELLDRGFGKVPQPVEGNQTALTVVNVVTGVRGRTVRDAAMSDETIKKAADRGIKLLDGSNPPVPSAPAAIQLLAEQHGREIVRARNS